MSKMYLVHYPEKPIVLSRKEPLHIGRADSNDIILHESRISRQHAKIEWDKSSEVYTLHDAGSTNGTYLNNKKIEANHPYALKDRDKIRIASAVLNCCAADRIRLLKNEFLLSQKQERVAVTQSINISELKEMHNHAEFIGELEHFCPIELFQILETGSKSGRLTINTPQKKGSFVVQKGRVITASFDDKNGEAAVFDVIKYNKGDFTFDAHYTPTEEPEITLNTTLLLMEGCRLLDELEHPEASESRVPAGG